MLMQAEVSEWEDEAHRRLEEADEKQRAADRCTRDGANARRELERLKKAVESSFEDLQRQVTQCMAENTAMGRFHCGGGACVVCMRRVLWCGMLDMLYLVVHFTCE